MHPAARASRRGVYRSCKHAAAPPLASRPRAARASFIYSIHSSFENTDVKLFIPISSALSPILPESSSSFLVLISNIFLQHKKDD